MTAHEQALRDLSRKRQSALTTLHNRVAAYYDDMPPMVQKAWDDAEKAMCDELRYQQSQNIGL